MDATSLRVDINDVAGAQGPRGCERPGYLIRPRGREASTGPAKAAAAHDSHPVSLGSVTQRQPVAARRIVVAFHVAEEVQNAEPAVQYAFVGCVRDVRLDLPAIARRCPGDAGVDQRA